MSFLDGPGGAPLTRTPSRVGLTPSSRNERPEQICNTANTSWIHKQVEATVFPLPVCFLAWFIFCYIFNEVGAKKIKKILQQIFYENLDFLYLFLEKFQKVKISLKKIVNQLVYCVW